MGNCFCQLHIHSNDPDHKEMINQFDNMENNNFPRDINSQLTNNSLQIKLKAPKLNSFESNIKKKLLQIGNFIQIKEFNKLIGNDILTVIQEQQLDYKQYISIPSSTKINLNPFQFSNTNDIYYGSWNEEAEMEGKGIFYSYKNKIVIEGFWSKGDNICGRIFFRNKDIYEGAINNSLPNGKGELCMSNGDLYSGEFKNGEMIFGVIIYKDDGTRYEGGIENGFFQGNGKMIWGNNIEYEGNFENSMFSGNGKITKYIDIDKKEVYEGEFNENEFHGKGKYYFSNGDIYEGDFEYGIKKGYGEYNRNNGDIIKFKGKWNDDFPNGNGDLTYNGYKLKGFWRNGDFMNSIEEENEVFDNIDKNIIPPKTSIFPNSLSHINVINTNTNISQYTQGGDFI